MKRRTEQARSRHTRKGSMKPKGRSRYGRKKAWLHNNPLVTGDARVELWGFNVPEPKPWK